MALHERGKRRKRARSSTPHAGEHQIEMTNVIAAPLLAAYALDRREARELCRLYDRREQMLEQLSRDYLAKKK